MDQATHNKIVSFIWGIADDVLRDLFKRGKYPDVILPMCVLRRLDTVLLDTHQAVLETKAMLDDAGITEQRQALCDAAGQAFYNTSKFTLRDLQSRNSQQQLRQDFEDYLDGFSPNVQDILENFKFRNQIPTLSKADALGLLIEKFCNPDINFSSKPVLNGDGSIRHPAMDNHSMGTIFEELVRKFNEDNNEEAGEHWTPRDAVKLMARLIFQPIAKKIKPGSYELYDGACGTGGMLTVAEETLLELAGGETSGVKTYLYGQEINPETFAICKADMLLKGEGENAESIKGGAEYSTLSNDAFPAKEFDFMLSNPPYGKSWKKDLETMCPSGKKDSMRDPRFRISHADEEDYSLITRSSDGQMMFLANMAAKMNHKTELGSRIAQVHNGSSLFTGDAGQGESNIRRWLIENDWVEAIVALPLNLFYNTGIATYIWVLSNKKPKARKGQVQLIDASQWYRPLRKNLGKKNCELAEEDIQRIMDTYIAFKPTEQSKIFPNAAFGYWKVVVERPLRLKSQLTIPRIEALRYASGDEEIRSQLVDEFGDALFEDFGSLQKALIKRLAEWGSDDEEDGGTPAKSLPESKKKKLLSAETWQRDARLVSIATELRKEIGEQMFDDHNQFCEAVDAVIEKRELKIAGAELKLVLRGVSWTDESASPVIATIHNPTSKRGKSTLKPDPMRGLYQCDKLPACLRPAKGRLEAYPTGTLVEFEPDPELRDSEQIPLLEEGGIEAFIEREVVPYTPDAWLQDKKGSTKIGYEISFTRHFYKPEPLRTLDEIRADIIAVEKEAEGLLDQLLHGGVA